jgi:hypothetical protein
MAHQELSGMYLLNGGIAYDSGFRDNSGVAPASPANAGWRFGTGGQKEESKTFNWGWSVEHLYGGNNACECHRLRPGCIGWARRRGGLVRQRRIALLCHQLELEILIGTSAGGCARRYLLVARRLAWRSATASQNCVKPFMTPKRMTRCAAFTLTFLLAAAAATTTRAATEPPKAGFETVPSLPGAELVPAALLTGPLHSVAEPVALEGFFGRYVIESKFGTFSVLGASMLGVRVNELHAIEALQKVQTSQAFQDSLARAAQAPVQLVQSAFTNPVGTVENIGQGFGNVLGRVGFLARSGAQSVADSTSGAAPAASGLPPAPAGEAMPSAFTGDPFGYNKARRDWARQLNIDPYTSNPVLRPLLDNASAASFAGSFAVNTAIGAVSMGANLVVGFDTDVRDAVWNQPPVDLARQNESRLLAMGVSGRTTRDFLRNRWFTPSLQTALAVAMAKMGGIAGAESVIQVASRVQGETHVRFFVQSVRMLGQYDGKEARLTKLRMSGMVPVGVADDGTLVAAAAIDYAYWDKAAAEFAQRKELKAKRRVLLIAGAASEQARQAFGKKGWLLRSGLRP